MYHIVPISNSYCKDCETYIDVLSRNVSKQIKEETPEMTKEEKKSTSGIAGNACSPTTADNWAAGERAVLDRHGAWDGSCSY